MYCHLVVVTFGLVNTSQMVGEEDWFFAPVEWSTGKIISKMTHTVLIGMLNPTIPIGRFCNDACNHFPVIWLSYKISNVTKLRPQSTKNSLKYFQVRLMIRIFSLLDH